MIVEMRTYRTKPGLRARFLDVFARKVVPAHQLLRMPICGPFTCVEDPDVFFFTRAFDDLSSREERKALFYEGDLWTAELESVLMPMLDRYDVAVVELANPLDLIAATDAAQSTWNENSRGRVSLA